LLALGKQSQRRASLSFTLTLKIKILHALAATRSELRQAFENLSKILMNLAFKNLLLRAAAAAWLLNS
jgi:hypothetical protein